MIGISFLLLCAGIVYCIYVFRAHRKAASLDKGADKGEVKRLFDKTDANRSGTIDKEELNELCKELNGHRLLDGELEEAMQEMDINQNGTVEFEEFYKWWHKHGGRALSKFQQKQEVAQMRELLFLYARVLVQPVKIVVGFGQIVGPLEKVLQIELPEHIKALVDVFKPLAADIWQSFLPVGCVVSLNYYQRWVFKVFVVPSVLLAAAYLWYAGERYYGTQASESFRNSERVKSTAARRLRGNLSLVVFVLYPTICNEVFATFNCRQLAVEMTLLVSDYAVDCSTTQYDKYFVLAVCMAVLFCAGIPIAAAVVLGLEEQRTTATDAFVAEALEGTWGIGKLEAVDAVLGVQLGRHYGFLIEAFRPGCFAWESLNMIRKLLMVGVIMVLVGRGTAAQLLIATMLSVLFLLLHIRSWPYKQLADNALKMAVEFQILCMVTVGLALKADPSADTTGYDIFLVTMLIVNIPVGFILACASKVHNAHHLLTQATDAHAEDHKKSYRLYMMYKAGLARDADMRYLVDYLEQLRQKGVGTIIMKIEGRTIAARVHTAATAADEQDDDFKEEEDSFRNTFFWLPQQQDVRGPATQEEAEGLALVEPAPVLIPAVDAGQMWIPASDAVDNGTTRRVASEANAWATAGVTFSSRAAEYALASAGQKTAGAAAAHIQARWRGILGARRFIFWETNRKEKILRKMEEEMATTLAKLEGHSSVNIISAPYMKAAVKNKEIAEANHWCFNPDVDFVEFGVTPDISDAGWLKCWLKIARIVAKKGGTAFFINHSKHGLLGTHQTGEMAIAQMVGCKIQKVACTYDVDDGAAATQKDDDNPFDKFSGGFEGSFADTATFFGGLVKLVGEPQKNVSEAVRAEHCDVLEGFGASRAEMTAGNYGVTFTPEREYLFVSDPGFAELMSCGVVGSSNRPPIPGGRRLPLDIRELSDPKVAVRRIRRCFLKMGWPRSAVTETGYASLQMTAIELVATRLYTGPMFVLYNGVLRSMTTGGTVRFGFDQHLIGVSVQGRFVTTLHAVNSGVIKLSRLQPKCKVYRGINGMKLPRSFVQPDAFGVRSGVEYGFMSTSMDRSVAEKYSNERDSSTDKPSLIMEMEMGMVNRGAFLGWLSQYPDESEILLPPLTGLEVTDFKTDDAGRLVYTMQLNINMQSMTIEEVQSLRKKQCLELAEVVGRDLASRVPVGDVPRRQAAAQQRQAAVETERDVNVFNNNARFVEETEATLAQLPRPGDEVETLRELHSKTVLALAGGSFGGEQLLLSGGLDGAVVVHGQLDRPRTEEFLTKGHDDLPTPVLCIAVLSPLPIATVGLFDGTVVAFGLGEGSQRQALHGHTSAVTALAWAAEPAYRLVGGSADGTIVVWQLDSGAADFPLLPANPMQCELTGHTDTICTVCWLSDSILASGSLDHTVRIWRLERNRDEKISGEFVQCLEQHSGPVTALALSTQGQLGEDEMLVSGSADRSICAWDSHSFELVAEKNQCHGLGVCTIEPLPARQLATASTDTTIKIWQLSVGGAFECLQTMRGHTDAVHALSYIDSKGWLASGGSDKTVRLWRVGEARLVENSPTGGATATKPTTLFESKSELHALPVARSMTPPRTQQAPAGHPVRRDYDVTDASDDLVGQGDKYTEMQNPLHRGVAQRPSTIDGDGEETFETEEGLKEKRRRGNARRT
jgi:WD40 repeat protein